MRYRTATLCALAAVAVIPAFVSAQAPIQAPIVLPCPVISHSLKMGGPNDAGQVARLQTFLKGYEGADLEISGSFDQRTEDAVKAFQKKHEDVILAPWGATRASGFVHITTLKKINEIACGAPLTLDTDEIRTIEEYHARGPVQGSIVSSDQMVETDQSGRDMTDDGEEGSSDDLSATASASASVPGLFWSFFKELFR